MLASRIIKYTSHIFFAEFADINLLYKNTSDKAKVSGGAPEVKKSW